MSPWQTAFLGGVAASVMASVIFLTLLTLLRPRIQISEFIVKRNNPNGQTDYLFKFVNRSWRACVDVEVQGFIVTEWLLPANPQGTKTAPNRTMHPLELARRGSYVHRRRLIFKVPHAPYAQRVRIDSEHIQEWQQSNQRKFILVRIAAKDGVSGFPKVAEMQYQLATCVKEGTFITGDSLEVTEWVDPAINPADINPPPKLPTGE
ncbi:MAG: hypothetical protein QOE52_3725 [Mycobacterium sp.]|jgi:hypothetical protein|nr:hypothetical protein [Mycobacterium sp.]